LNAGGEERDNGAQVMPAARIESEETQRLRAGEEGRELSYAENRIQQRQVLSCHLGGKKRRPKNNGSFEALANGREGNAGRARGDRVLLAKVDNRLLREREGVAGKRLPREVSCIQGIRSEASQILTEAQKGKLKVSHRKRARPSL